MDVAMTEVKSILARLKEDDPQFEANARSMFGRPPYEIASDHELLKLLETTVGHLNSGRAPSRIAATFWCDTAILGLAGIPSVIFGPGGDGLHGLEEYVRVDDVLACRDALVALTRLYCV